MAFVRVLCQKGYSQAQAAIEKCSKQSDTPMYLMLGLNGAGKTTLLYRLKCKSWEEEDIVKDMADLREWRKTAPKTEVGDGDERTSDAEDGAEDKEAESEKLAPLDAGYHYEEFNRLYPLGIWDLPGTEAMRHMWSTFYRTIKIHGVIFVVNADDADPERGHPGGKEEVDDEEARKQLEERDRRIDLSRKLLHGLMNEDELRLAAFAVIINLRKKGRNALQAAVKEKQVFYRLGLHDVHPQAKERMKDFTFDVVDMHETHKSWTSVIEHMRVVVKNPTISYGLKI